MLTTEQQEVAHWVADQVELHPNGYDQESWGEALFPRWLRWREGHRAPITVKTEEKVDWPQLEQLLFGEDGGCNTPQCIAGWAIQYDVLEQGKRGLSLKEWMIGQCGKVVDLILYHQVMVRRAGVLLGMNVEDRKVFFGSLSFETTPQQAATLLRTASDKGWRKAGDYAFAERLIKHDRVCGYLTGRCCSPE